MTRIKCTVSYDGSSFNGYQRQPGQRTVQGEIEKVLSLINKAPSKKKSKPKKQKETK